MKEIVTILSGGIALVSVALIFLAVSSKDKAPSVFVLCIIGLAVLGIVYKLCSLIFRPILALSNISVIGGFNMFFGAVMGAAEAAVFSYLLYCMLDYLGIYIL